MPLFTHDLRRMRAASPAKSQLETMIASCKELEEPINVIVEDGEEFGGISEETFCYTAPVHSSSLLLSITNPLTLRRNSWTPSVRYLKRRPTAPTT